MASRREEHQEDAKFKLMQMINHNPELTSREIAKKIGISNGSAYYLLISMVDKGFVKLANFKESSQKAKYSYLLTPKGIREKSLLTNKFLILKKEEYKALKDEIIQLEHSAGLDIKVTDAIE
jgi:EPS-associated MarR family transcriptional regulator